jgi:hypothetical protein
MTTPFPFVAGAVLTAAELNAITTLPINDQTASYTLVVGDVGKRVVMNVASANTVTVDDSIFGVGDTIFIANKGAGATTVTAGSGVTINTAGSLVIAQHGGGTLVATSASVFTFLPFAAGAGAVVQVKSVTKTNTFTTTSTSFVDLTDLTLSITPTSATNKILCFYSVIASGLAGTNMGGINLVRGATAISQADAAGSRTVASSIVPETAAATSGLVSNSFLDSPATTSATTYKLQIRTGGPGTIVVNRTGTDSDNSAFLRGTSSLTIMEVTP